MPRAPNTPPASSTTVACCSVSMPISRSKRRIWLRPAAIARRSPHSTARVVIFTPPAVEPEPAPMNIRMIIRNSAGAPKAPIGSELKPAVRQTTDWKKACPIARQRRQAGQDAIPLQQGEAERCRPPAGSTVPTSITRVWTIRRTGRRCRQMRRRQRDRTQIRRL